MQIMQVQTGKSDSRGYWEYQFFQKTKKKGENSMEEQNIKVQMRPDNMFDPKYINDYINPPKPKEIVILEKYENKQKLSKAEEIILNNYIEKRDKAIKNDIEDIKKNGINAKPQTKEGRLRLLLTTLQQQIKKNNTDIICNIYLRLQEDQFKMTDEIYKEYKNDIEKMNSIVQNCDLIELQFTKLHNQMPPLNSKGFQKFDDWQVKIIENINNNISTILSAPTSAGKTVLSGYATTKGKTLIVVPTDALAWQMASYVGGILNKDIPILTPTHMTIPKRDMMVDLINSSEALVGTADTIVDFLPLINVKFDWIIFDEIHMIGKKEGCDMEIIAKVFNDVPFLALSATIGNVNELGEWFQKINDSRKVEIIDCKDRFFNLQKYFYNSKTNKIDMINPLSMIEVDDFKTKTVLQKTLQPTPQDTWTLYKKICQIYGNLNEYNHTEYFGKTERIHLSKSSQYFSDLLKYLCDNFDNDKISCILNSFKHDSLDNETVNIYDLIFLLKNEHKTPVIIFQKDTLACLRLVRQLSKMIDKKEHKKYPKLLADRLKEHKTFKKLEKQLEKNEFKIPTIQNNTPGKTDKKEESNKEKKLFLSDNDEYKKLFESFTLTSLQEPTPEFNINTEQYFSEGTVEEWVNKLKRYFPSSGNEYHFIIKLLWRGVGVYCKGLPDPYLRLVQSLASKKLLAVVFSDMSLVFGVSMPFRTVVIYRDSTVEDTLDTMLYCQMAGRAGRRGLDKEGNIIFAGYSWSRIQELSTSKTPIVQGINIINNMIPHAMKIAELKNNSQNWLSIFSNPLNKNNDEEQLEMYREMESNYENSWNFAMNDDINYLHMNWCLRKSDDGLIASYLIPYICKGFDQSDPDSENDQVKVALFLSHFINVKEYNDDNNLLEESTLFQQQSFSQIKKKLNNIQLFIPSKIDGRVFNSIKQNKLLKFDTEQETGHIRQQLIEFGLKIRTIQHYCYHSKMITVARLLGKLCTRIWWIYHTSSPLTKPYHEFDNDNFNL